MYKDSLLIETLNHYLLRLHHLATEIFILLLKLEVCSALIKLQVKFEMPTVVKGLIYNRHLEIRH